MSLAPFFEKAPSIINKPDGSVLFECMCNANPEPTIQWFFKVILYQGSGFRLFIFLLL